MTEADSVHSTPPLRTSSIQRLSRRKALAGLALLPAVVPAVAAAAEPDHVFALIAAHRAGEAAICTASDAQDEAEIRHGFRSEEAWDAAERSGEACRTVDDVAWALAQRPPTTLAGIVAVLRFANEVEDAGGDWPDTDTIGPEGWHYQLRATIAAAIEAIVARGQS
jgi:hypothetical protein